MTDLQWRTRLYQQAMTDELCCLCREQVCRTEPDYLAIREGLDDIQQMQLDDYLTACEALEDSLLRLAYELGRSEQD